MVLHVCAAFSVAFSAGPQKKIHTIGDATMLEDDTDKFGWVQMLQQYFTDNISINNRGKSGASSKSYYVETPLWQSLLKGGKDEMHEGDFLLIQFAHNDEKNDGADGIVVLLHLRHTRSISANSSRKQRRWV